MPVPSRPRVPVRQRPLAVDPSKEDTRDYGRHTYRIYLDLSQSPSENEFPIQPSPSHKVLASHQGPNAPTQDSDRFPKLVVRRLWQEECNPEGPRPDFFPSSYRLLQSQRKQVQSLDRCQSPVCSYRWL